MGRRPSFGAWAAAARGVALALLLLLGIAAGRPASAQVMADWGTVATPITSPVTFTFSQSNVDNNFTHQYVFTLAGSADAAYSVSFLFDACRNGCGSPVLNYGIAGEGALSESPTGAYVLAPGTYTFTVTGTGMGSGNSVDYWGSVVISAGDPAMVSPVPEPESALLVLPGLVAVAAAVRRRRRRDERQPPATRGATARPRPAALAPALLLAVLPASWLAGCAEAPAPRPTQVVAKVGGTEISALQLDNALKAQRGPSGADPDRQATLAKLIDRELAVQQALARKLDRQPEVVLRLEELRREVLATAYAEQVAAAQPRPTAEAVRAFHDANPELFAQRKIYRLRELVIPVPSPHLAEAKARLVQRQPPEAIAAWLAREKARFSVQEVVRPAEQVPIEALPALHRAADGQVAVFEAPQAVYVYQVQGTQSAPLDLAGAEPRIAAHLARQAGERAMRAELQSLRSATAVEIVGRPLAGAAAAPKTGT